MEVMTYSDTRARLKDVMEHVVEDNAPVVVTRQKAEPVVMVSLSDWNAMVETMHLFSTATNASRLMAAIGQLDRGQGKVRDLIEP